MKINLLLCETTPFACTCTCFSHCRCESGHTVRRPDVHPSQWAPLWVHTVSGWSACRRTRSPASAQLTHSQSPERENAPRVSTGIQEGYWWALEQTMGNTERSKKAQQSAKASNLIYLGFEDHNWKIWGKCWYMMVSVLYEPIYNNILFNVSYITLLMCNALCTCSRSQCFSEADISLCSLVSSFGN